MFLEALIRLITPGNLKQLLLSVFLAVVTLIGFYVYQGFISELFIIPLLILLTISYMAILSTYKAHKVVSGKNKKVRK